MRKIAVSIAAAAAVLIGFAPQADAQVWIRRPLGDIDFEFYRRKPDTVSVYILGDVMSHGAMMRSAHGKWLDANPGADDNPSDSRQYDYSDFFLHLRGRIEGADIAVCNMEFPLAGPPFQGYPSFSGPDSYPDYLAAEGFDLITLANNHILDQGLPGLNRTVRICRDVSARTGMAVTGIAADKVEDEAVNPAILESRGIRIAFIGFTYGTNSGPLVDWPKVCRMDKGDILRQIGRARDKGADFIVALPHWGVEYAHNHSSSQEEWARWLASNGVDAIVGSHPHVPQDTCLIGRVPVIYSIGNAVSNQNDLPARLELGAALRFLIHSNGFKELLDARTEYLWCTKPGMIEESYTVIPVREFISTPERWRVPGDWNNMVNTYRAVQNKTKLYEENHPSGSH